ncbi:MAG: phosphatidate cytidylyltransferase [Candidatus Puniceispirillum sp.]
MVAGQLSGTRQRWFGVVFLLPVIAAFAVGQWVAGAMLVLLAAIMAVELRAMLALAPAAEAVLVALLVLPAVPLPTLGFFDHLLFGVVAALTAGGVVFFYKPLIFCVFTVLLVLCLFAANRLLALESGQVVLLSLAAVIAACDSAAYFAGRFFGGPKLLVAVSPNKTISGSMGGLVAASISCVILADFLYLDSIYAAIGAGVVLGVVAQSGDLLESAVKRRAGVKDSGTIIPGHGGLLDRFDGYLLVLPVALGYISFL